MNSYCYMAVLDEKLFRFTDLHGAMHFLQDRASCHTSKKVMGFLREKRIAVMDWPGNLPDLNPIENLWLIIKKGLKDNHTITSLPKLQEATKRLGENAQQSDEETGALHNQEAEAEHG
jgi:transposase